MYPASLGSVLTWRLAERTHPDRVPRVRFTAIFESMDGVVIARVVPALFVLFTWILGINLGKVMVWEVKRKTIASCEPPYERWYSLGGCVPHQ